MKFKIKYADQIVGMFVIIAAVCISILLMFMGINQRWFSKNYYYNTRFLSAESLKSGMPIKLKGFQIGQLDKVELSDMNEVLVTFYIYSEYHDKIKPNSIIQVIRNPVGIGGDIVIHPGSIEGDPLPEDSFIPSFNLPEAQELLLKGLVSIPGSDNTVNRIINQIDPLINNVNRLLDSLASLTITIDATIKGEMEGPTGSILSNVDDMTSSLNIILAETSKRIAVLLNDIENITGNVSLLTDHIADPTGIVPKLMGPDGSAAAFFDDNRVIFKQIENILESLEKTMDEVALFTIYLNKSTPQLTGIIEESRGALREGTAVLEGLKNNPLLRGGITQTREQPDTIQNKREEVF